MFDYYPARPGGEPAPRLQDLTDARLAARRRRPTSTGPNAHAWSDVDDDNVARRRRGGRAGGRRLQLRLHRLHGQRARRAAPPTHLCCVGPGRRPRELADQPRAVGTPRPSSWSTSSTTTSPPRRSASTRTRATSRATDPVLTQSFDGADTAGDGGPDTDHINNANMDTPPDGESPTMQLYLFEYSAGALVLRLQRRRRRRPCGTSTRTGSPTGSSSTRTASARSTAPHAGAMGEAWSDWYAEDLLVREGLETDDPDLERRHRHRRAVRRGPPRHALRPRRSTARSARAPPTPRRPAPAARSPAPAATRSATSATSPRRPRGPRRRRDLGPDAVGPAPALVGALGSDTAGSDAAEAADHRRHAPLAARAEHARHAQRDPAGRHRVNGGDLHDLIWAAFAHRGMGFYATAFDGNDVEPAEDFNAAAGRRRAAGHPARHASPTRRPASRSRASRVRLRRRDTAGRRLDTTGADGRYEIDGITGARTRSSRCARRQRRLRPGRRRQDRDPRRRDDDQERRARPQLGVEGRRRVRSPATNDDTGEPSAAARTR